jgi:hypothetical protein
MDPESGSAGPVYPRDRQRRHKYGGKKDAVPDAARSWRWADAVLIGK